MSIREQVRVELQKATVLKDVKYSKGFYFEKVEDGLFQNRMPIKHTLMFDKGSGSELKDKGDELAKAKAIDSSSMLSYNFFSWVSAERPLTLFGIKYTQVYFEIRLKTLTTSNAPANLDVALVSGDNKNVLFIESKFLEYLSNEKSDISTSYTDEKRYFKENKYIGKLTSLAKEFNGKSCGYYEGIKQNICHFVAISNLKSQKAIDYAREKNVEAKHIFADGVSYKFINLIYKPKPELKGATERFNAYTQLLGDFKSKIGECQSLLANDQIFKSYSDIYKELKAEQNINNVPKNLLGYLKSRYDISD